MNLTITIPGRPIAKGNKRPFVVNGHAVMAEGNPKAKVWENAVRDAAARERDRCGLPGLMTGPVRASVTFQFARPKSHYRTGKHAGELRLDAPNYHTQKPDTDKILRSFGDALTGVLLTDDAIVAHWSAWKVWGPCDETTVIIGPIDLKEKT